MVGPLRVRHGHFRRWWRRRFGRWRFRTRRLFPPVGGLYGGEASAESELEFVLGVAVGARGDGGDEHAGDVLGRCSRNREGSAAAKTGNDLRRKTERDFLLTTILLSI